MYCISLNEIYLNNCNSVRFVYFSTSVLSRCIPDLEKLIKAGLNKADLEGVQAFLNADNIFKKVLADFYKCWKEIVFLCLIALGEYSFLNILIPVIIVCLL